MPRWTLTIDRMMKRKITKDPSGCWLWIGRMSKGGYGRVNSNHKQWLAHRFFYTQMRGEIPDGMQIDHLCKNRRCVNPEHLEAVTSRENNRRSESPSAKNALRLKCIHGHALSGENLYVTPDGRRQCKACRAARTSEYIRKKAV